MVSPGRQIRVAIVVPTHWDFLMGGAQLQAKILLEELVSRPGVDVNYLASRVNPDAKTGSDYTLTQIAKPGALHRYGLFWDFLSLQRRLTEYQPHVIYQRVATAYTGISARYAQKNNIPMIWHVANSTDCAVSRFGLSAIRRPHGYLEKSLIEYGLKNADTIVVQNKDQQDQLRNNFGKENAVLIPNFHPVPPIPEEREASPLRLIWIANLKDNKQPQAMVDIARKLEHHSDLQITMVGAPHLQIEQEKQESFERSISDLSNLTYTGAIPLEEVNSLLEQSHLLVNTSVKEGFSNTFIQAWMRCVPVFTLGVNPDNRLDGGALGTSFSSIEALVAAVEDLKQNRSQLVENGRAAREIAKRDFSLDNASTLADLVLSKTS